MARVLLKSTRRAGGTKSVAPRLAEALVRRGGWEYADEAPAGATAPEPAPAQPTDYAAMPYNELRRIASERKLGLGRATKDEMVAALGKLDRGRYQRRDMRAAE